VDKIATLTLNLQTAKEELIKRKVLFEMYKKQLEEKKNKIKECLERINVLEKVRLLLQLASEYARKQAKQQLETLVTQALQYIFGSNFSLEIELNTLNNNPSAEFYVVTKDSNKIIKTRPYESRGGGVVDVVSLAVRIALLEIIKPKIPGPLILDEPGKHVSEDYILAFINFLKSITNTFQRQVILITHNTYLMESADISYFVRYSDGKTSVNNKL